MTQVDINKAVKALFEGKHVAKIGIECDANGKTVGWWTSWDGTNQDDYDGDNEKLQALAKAVDRAGVFLGNDWTEDGAELVFSLLAKKIKSRLTGRELIQRRVDVHRDITL